MVMCQTKSALSSLLPVAAVHSQAEVKWDLGLWEHPDMIALLTVELALSLLSPERWIPYVGQSLRHAATARKQQSPERVDPKLQNI